MKRATITVPTGLEEALERYISDQDVPPALTALVQAALVEFLTERGYLNDGKRLRIRPAATGSGRTDVSVEHDRYLAES